MPRTRALFAASAVAAASLAGSVLLPGSAEAASSLDGCPAGAVCIYADAMWQHLTSAYITDEYWSYGAHNLVNEYGWHYIVNNQTGGGRATALLCYGYNGGNCTASIVYPGDADLDNLTPVNSIVLNRP